MSTAAMIPLKKFAVAVVAAIARSSGCPKTKRRPSPMSGTAGGGRPPVPPGPAHGCGWRHRHRRDEEAPGVDGDGVRGRRSPATRPPARLGPATWATWALRGELGVALDQMVAAHEGGQVRLVGDVEEHRQHAGDQGHHVQLGHPELHPRRTPPGTEPRASTRPTSDAIMTRRRRMRSTQTPAGRPTSRKRRR